MSGKTLKERQIFIYRRKSIDNALMPCHEKIWRYVLEKCTKIARMVSINLLIRRL